MNPSRVVVLVLISILSLAAGRTTVWSADTDGPGGRRTEVPKFVSRPSARADGENVRIEFEVDKAIDVAVEIQDKDGGVLRHLVAGQLGPHAPQPLTSDSLKQSLLWDRKDDSGKPVAAGPAKVRVGLGMGVRLAGVEAASRFGPLPGEKPDGLNIHSLIDLTVGPDGTVYLMGGYIYLDNIDVYTHIVAMDREGNYLRELYPPPAALTPDKTAGLKFLKLADGSSIPQVDGICWLYNRKLAFAGKMAVTPDNQSLLVAASKSRDLFRFGLDGSLPAAAPMSLPEGDLKADRTGLAWNWFASSVAVSPDSRSLYVIGKAGTGEAARPAVYSVNLADGKSAVFFGEGDGRTLTRPTGLAVDSAGNVLIADCGADRVWVVAADGKQTREVKSARPFSIGAGPKGSIYVLSAVADPLEVLAEKLTKLSADGQEVATVDLAPIFGKKGAKRTGKTLAGFGVDMKADKPLIWIGCTTTNAYSAGCVFNLSRFADEGDSFGQRKILECNNRLVQTTLRQFDSALAFRRPWDAKFGYGSNVVQPDGYRYGQLWDGKAKPPAGQLTRCDADGKEAPFPEMGEKKWYQLVGSDRTGYGYNPRVLMTPQKDLLVSYLRPLAAGKGDYGPDDFACEGPDKLTHDGKYIRDFIFGMMSIAGKAPYRVDSQGSVYTADHTLPPGRFAPAEVEAALPGHTMHPRDPFVAAYGSIYKFPPTGGGLVWDANGTRFKDPPVTQDDLIRKPTVVADKIAKPAWRGGCENIEWQFIGVSPVPSARLNICTCTGVVFDLDALDRLYVPDAYRMCVHVLDRSGNVLLRIGRYGNQDDGRKQIAFARPRTVQILGGRIVIGDYQNSLTTHLDVVYAAEGAAPLP